MVSNKGQRTHVLSIMMRFSGSCFFGAHHASKGSDTQKWFIEQIVATSESLEMGGGPHDLDAVFLSGPDFSASFSRNLGSSFAYCSRMAYT